MTTYIIDSETNGFLEDLDTIFSLVIRDHDTGTVLSCCDDPNYVSPFGATVAPIALGIRILESLTEDDTVVAHNMIKFDGPAIRKVFPKCTLKRPKRRDTLLLTRLIWPQLRDDDFKFSRKHPEFPKKLIGRHSLEAWGWRLGNRKDEYTGGFEAWNTSMQEYCEQDVDTLADLWDLCLKRGYAEKAVDIEHRFAEVIFLQEQFGFPFDTKAAVDLYTTLCQRRLELESLLKETFKPWWAYSGVKTPPRTITYKDATKASFTKGCPFSQVKLTEFNPSSRDHIAERLTALYGWKPTEFTPEGKPKIDETTLADLVWPEAQLLNEYLMVGKRIGQVGEGAQAWLKQVKADGRMHGSVMTIGAVTRRCTHSNPNVAQAPSVENAKGKVPYGHECRALFTALPGYRLVGVDGSGLELRCLAHYMARYDGGAYGELILNGDVHTANQLAAGLPGRQQAKTFIYAFLYGAGDEKIGSIVQQGRAKGKALKASFLAKTPALKRLRQDIDARVSQVGYLNGIDGGRLAVRHKHAALNTLLQSAGAIAMKLALVLLYDDLSARGWVHGVDYAFVANIHDEIQAVVQEAKVDDYKEAGKAAIRQAGIDLGFRCPLAGDAKDGWSWADTH